MVDVVVSVGVRDRGGAGGDLLVFQIVVAVVGPVDRPVCRTGQEQAIGLVEVLSLRLVQSEVGDLLCVAVLVEREFVAHFAVVDYIRESVGPVVQMSDDGAVRAVHVGYVAVGIVGVAGDLAERVGNRFQLVGLVVQVACGAQYGCRPCRSLFVGAVSVAVCDRGHSSPSCSCTAVLQISRRSIPS